MTSFIEKMPLLTLIKRFLKNFARNSIVFIVKIVQRALLLSNKHIRAAIFIAAKPNTLMLSQIGAERFLVSSNDSIIGRKIYVNGMFDFEKFEKIFLILDKSFEPDLLIDIGANIGTICIPALKRGFFNRAIAFEPEPFNYSLLASNININGLSNKITAYNIALGENGDEELEFELSESNYGDHRIRLLSTNGINDEAERKVIRVKSESLDKVLANIDTSKMLIWMDTQGFEGYVLSGAKQILKNRPPMVIEFWPYGMNRSGSYKSLKKAISEAGYKVFYNLSENSLPVEVSETAFDMLFKQLGGDGDFTDLLII